MDPVRAQWIARVRNVLVWIVSLVYHYTHLARTKLYEVVYPRDEFHVDSVLFINNHDDPSEPDVIDARDEPCLGEIPKTDLMTDYRVEIRYVLNGESFRYVVNHDDLVNARFPPYAPQQAARPPFARSIMMATVRFADGHVQDVTRRLKKYAGPRGDFYGGKVRSAWVFPMLHHHSTDGAMLSFLDTRLKLQTFPLDDNDFLALSDAE